MQVFTAKVETTLQYTEASMDSYLIILAVRRSPKTFFSRDIHTDCLENTGLAEWGAVSLQRPNRGRNANSEASSVGQMLGVKATLVSRCIILIQHEQPRISYSVAKLS